MNRAEYEYRLDPKNLMLRNVHPKEEDYCHEFGLGNPTKIKRVKSFSFQPEERARAKK